MLSKTNSCCSAALAGGPSHGFGHIEDMAVDFPEGDHDVAVDHPGQGHALALGQTLFMVFTHGVGLFSKKDPFSPHL